MENWLISFIAGILVGFIFGWLLRSNRTVPESEHVYYGSISIDMNAKEKDIMKFEFKKHPGDIYKYKYIYFDVNPNADLSQNYSSL